MIRHILSSNEAAWLIGRYGGLILILGILKLKNQPWFPHRHDGYISYGGYVHACSQCKRLPDGAYRAGFNGTTPREGTDQS